MCILPGMTPLVLSYHKSLAPVLRVQEVWKNPPILRFFNCKNFRKSIQKSLGDCVHLCTPFKNLEDGLSWNQFCFLRYTFSGFQCNYNISLSVTQDGSQLSNVDPVWLKSFITYWFVYIRAILQATKAIYNTVPLFHYIKENKVFMNLRTTFCIQCFHLPESNTQMSCSWIQMCLCLLQVGW